MNLGNAPAPRYEHAIVGLCSGNVQRSPSFEAVMRYELSQRGEPAGLVTSAGLNVAAMRAGTLPLGNMIKGIGWALEYGLVPAERRAEAESYVARWRGRGEQASSPFDPVEDTALAQLHATVRPLIRERNVEYRNQALREARIPEEFVPGSFRPFEPWKETGIVVPMERGYGTRVSAMYRDAARGEHVAIEDPSASQPRMVRAPHIVAYPDLVDGPDLPDNPSGGIAEARHVVEYLMQTRERAADGLLALLRC